MYKTNRFNLVILCVIQRKRFRRSMLCLFALIVTLSNGCYTTVNLTTADLNTLENETIDLRTADGSRYIFEKYSISDTAGTIWGKGYLIKNETKRPFDDAIVASTIKSMTYKKFETSKTITFVLLYFLVGGIGFAIR